MRRATRRGVVRYTTVNTSSDKYVSDPIAASLRTLYLSFIDGNLRGGTVKGHAGVGRRSNPASGRAIKAYSSDPTECTPRWVIHHMRSACPGGLNGVRWLRRFTSRAVEISAVLTPLLGELDRLVGAGTVVRPALVEHSGATARPDRCGRVDQHELALGGAGSGCRQARRQGPGATRHCGIRDRLGRCHPDVAQSVVHSAGSLTPLPLFCRESHKLLSYLSQKTWPGRLHEEVAAGQHQDLERAHRVV